MGRHKQNKLKYNEIYRLKAQTTKFLLVVLCLLSFLFVCNQTTQAYNIQPAVEDLVLEINQEKTSSIHFTNTTQETENFKVYSNRYNPEKEEIIEERNFLTTNIDSFSLKPGEKFEIEYKVNIPDDTIAGTYFSIIVVENVKAKKPTGSSGIGINYGIGSLIAMHVVDDTDIGDIFLTKTEVELSYKKPLNPFNTEIEYRIKNNSKYTFLPKGQLIIGSKNQKPLFYQINAEEMRLYPYNELVFDFNYSGNIKDLIVNKKATAKIGMQFSSVLRETDIELPFLNRTLTIVSTFLIIAVITTTVVLVTKKQGDKKLKTLFKKQLKQKKIPRKKK